MPVASRVISPRKASTLQGLNHPANLSHAPTYTRQKNGFIVLDVDIVEVDIVEVCVCFLVGGLRLLTKHSGTDCVRVYVCAHLTHSSLCVDSKPVNPRGKLILARN